MNVLVNVPIWVYFVIMGITFMVTHVVAYDPNRVVTRSSGLTTVMRIGSSVILLVGLLIMQPAAPATLLLALGLSALGGYLSGRAAPPPRVPAPEDDTQEPQKPQSAAENRPDTDQPTPGEDR